jgi:uncharacterized protein YxeA
MNHTIHYILLEGDIFKKVYILLYLIQMTLICSCFFFHVHTYNGTFWLLYTHKKIVKKEDETKG